MQALENLTAESIISRELIDEIFSETNEIERSSMIAMLSARAKELKILGIFSNLIKERTKIEREILKPSRSGRQDARYTDFQIPEEKQFDNMLCGSWYADENGVYSLSQIGMEQRACHHPILPVKRLQNVQTGEEKLEIAFKRNGAWRTATFDKDVVSSANKIVLLSKFGVGVTSENAKHLVKYLSDVENFNESEIPLQQSTTKLGWHGDLFIPYDAGIIFDGDSKFSQLYDAVTKPAGDFGTWRDHMVELRKTRRREILFNLAASFASVLVKPLGILPFFVDLWGETEGGKTVCLMLGASVWGNPDGNSYIGDYKSTDVALEVKADMLNSLPMMLDDSSNATKRIMEDFENLIYRFCSGKGKSRSNKDLGTSRENTWKCCFITNGERPLSGYVSQGGALNRIIEVPCGQNIFENPSRTAEILKANYGHAGKLFVYAVKAIGIDQLREDYKQIVSDVSSDQKMQKQAMSLACILLADRLADEYIFRDGQRLTIEEATQCLIDRNDLSENERCYRYLVDMVQMNSAKFDPDSNTEHWGFLKDEYVCFYPTAFDSICASKGFSSKSFLAWAEKTNKLDAEEGRTRKLVKVGGKPIRVVKILIEDSTTDFVELSEEDKKIAESFR